MVSFSCPSCGAQVNFQSSLSIFAVCAYCQASLIRKDLEIENLGKMSLPLNDVSPLQLGTEGTYQGKHFTLIGRVKKTWSDGYWNEWYAWFESGEQGWLAEAQGFYSIAFEIPLGDGIRKLERLKPGSLFSYEGTDFHVVDIKESKVTFGEGELPYIGEKGKKSLSMDLIADPNQFASLEEEGELCKFFRGEYLEFPEFKFKRLRELEGW